MRKYYEAYEDRYQQVHRENLQWSSHEPSDIVAQVMGRFGILKHADILELGCGEGRDAAHLMKLGYYVTATDISSEAIRYCREENPEFAECFQHLDCVAGEWQETYDFIYAVAVVHMLVEEADRDGFYRFIRGHLKENGIALVCTMGDGTVERSSEISTAFDLQERNHGATGRKMMLAGTSCRMVSWDSFLREIRANGLTVVEKGMTAVEPDFPVMMYAVVH